MRDSYQTLFLSFLLQGGALGHAPPVPAQRCPEKNPPGTEHLQLLQNILKNSAFNAGFGWWESKGVSGSQNLQDQVREVRKKRQRLSWGLYIPASLDPGCSWENRGQSLGPRRAAVEDWGSQPGAPRRDTGQSTAFLLWLCREQDKDS